MEYVCDVSLWASLLREHGYDLLGQLDSGSFSEVFSVRSLTDNRVLAVKRMVARREINLDPRILKEIACLKQLNIRGACVIRLEQTIWKLDRLACLVLELAPMGDLERHAMKHWPVSSRLVSGTIRQVLSALTHCHRLQIAHRDVNPANVLLMSEHSVRLADFGLAFHCRHSSGRRLLCEDYLGRDSYLAPEVLLCTPYDALQADMWSMSSLCVFLLTGKHPPPHTYSLFSVMDCGHSASVTESSPPQRTCSSLHHPQPCLLKVPPSTTRSKHSRRFSSYDSEGSCRSESDVDEPVSLSSSPDADSDCVSPRSSCGEDCCQWGGVQAPETVEEDVFKQLTAADCAAVNLTSRLRVVNPTDRLKAEDALALWKSISS